jgi:hypothetical protein
MHKTRLLPIGRFGATTNSTTTLILQGYPYKPHLVKYVYSMMIFFIMRDLLYLIEKSGYRRWRRENERERVCEMERGWRGLRHGMNLDHWSSIYEGLEMG